MSPGISPTNISGADAESDEEVRRLYEVKDALGLADNDALWLILVALEHYDALYRTYPAQIAEHARRTIADVQRGFAAAAAIESKRAHRKLAEAVADAGVKIASPTSRISWTTCSRAAWRGRC